MQFTNEDETLIIHPDGGDLTIISLLLQTQHTNVDLFLNVTLT